MTKCGARFSGSSHTHVQIHREAHKKKTARSDLGLIRTIGPMLYLLPCRLPMETLSTLRLSPQQRLGRQPELGSKALKHTYPDKKRVLNTLIAQVTSF